MRGEGHLGRQFRVVGSEDGVTRVKVGEGVREERTKRWLVIVCSWSHRSRTDHEEKQDNARYERL